MQDERAYEARTYDGHVLGQSAIVLVYFVHIESNHVLKEQHDEHTLAESGDQDVDENCGAPQVPFLVDAQHLGLPLLMPLLVLIDLAIELIVVKVHFNILASFWGLRSMVLLLVIEFVLGEDGLVDYFVAEHACETQRVDIFVKCKVGAYP